MIFICKMLETDSCGSEIATSNSNHLANAYIFWVIYFVSSHNVKKCYYYHFNYKENQGQMSLEAT